MGLVPFLLFKTALFHLKQISLLGEQDVIFHLGNRQQNGGPHLTSLSRLGPLANYPILLFPKYSAPLPISPIPPTSRHPGIPGTAPPALPLWMKVTRSAMMQAGSGRVSGLGWGPKPCESQARTSWETGVGSDSSQQLCFFLFCMEVHATLFLKGDSHCQKSLQMHSSHLILQMRKQRVREGKRLILDPSRLRQDQCWDSGLPAHTYCFLAFLFLIRLKGAGKRRSGWWSATPPPASWATRRKKLNLPEPHLLFSARGRNT